MPVTASRNPPLEPRPRAELPLWLQALVRHDGLRLSVTVGAPILALVVVLAFFGFQLLGSIAREQDSNWADHTRSLVRKSLDGKVALNANVALDYGNWSDAWLATRGELDEAWLEPNFQTVVASALAVWRPGTGVRYLFTDERAEGRAQSLRAVLDGWAGVAPPDAAGAPGPAAAAVTSRVDEIRAGQFNTLVLLDGTLAAISARPIRPEEGSPYQLPPSGSTDWSVSVRMIDTDVLAETAVTLDLEAMRFVPADGDPAAAARLLADPTLVALPVHDGDGAAVGAMVWKRELPGTVAFERRLFPIAIAMLLAGVMAVLVARRAVSGQLRALSAARAAAEDGSRAKSAFLTGISHELRTPLNAIIGYAEILQEDGEARGNATAASDAARITRSARHLLALINDLLDHSKIEAGKMDLFVERVSLLPLVEEAMDTVRPAVEANGSRLVLNCIDDPGEALVDAMRLKQCLLNLLSNAAKFTRDGQVTVHVRSAVVQDAPGLRLEVQDTGIGMSSDALARLFQPFVQAEASTASRFGGTGLGLVITRALVEAMGGSIGVESAVGQGSSFTILLPRGLDSVTTLEAARTEILPALQPESVGGGGGGAARPAA